MDRFDLTIYPCSLWFYSGTSYDAFAIEFLLYLSTVIVLSIIAGGQHSTIAVIMFNVPVIATIMAMIMITIEDNQLL